VATHDYVIANGTGAAVRSDLNGALAAIVSNNSSASEPSPTYAYMWWADTTTGLLKQRNSANAAWITIGTLASTNLGLLSLAGGTLTGALLADDSGTVALPAIAFDGDTNTGIFRAGADQLGIATNGVERVEFGNTEVVFNDDGADVDFRVEGDTNQDLFKIDAGLDQVQVANLNGGPLAGTRNRIINGDMRIDQRNAGASVTLPSATVTYVLDRWAHFEDTDGTATVQRSTVAPAGFTNSLLVTTTTADGSLAATQRLTSGQVIEGFNAADLGWGAAGALSVTISFWVRSSLTGTFGAVVKNGANNRSYPFSYSISSANTWEYKTVLIPGDTAGTWPTDNSPALAIIFGLGVGSTYSGTAGSWQAADFSSATGAVSVIGTLNATWQITGVQLEPGAIATPFERRSYGQELALCQRYFFAVNSGPVTRSVNFSTGTVTVYSAYQLPVSMRVTPTLTAAGDINDGAAFTTWQTLLSPGSQSVFFAKDNVPAGQFMDVNTITASAEL
jgi:hypothetical protein